MASATMSSNKQEPTVFDIKKPKSGSSVRRWFHVFKHATLKNRQNDTDSLKIKPHRDSAPCTPEPSTTEGEPESPQTEAEDPKEPTGSHCPSPTTTPKAKPTLPVPSFEPLHQALASVPEDTASPSVPETSASLSVPAKNSTRATASKSRQHRKTTMITPELMQQIQTSNRKHSSSPLLNGGELRTKTLGTVTSTNRAKEVLASPLRWSEQ
ncbi:hypothetical protein yc1106_04548 [Curvularia clavata]|uniref:Uncharacterized protein n=1 Tax=Curvularia clavata TaxID=95742 RepID=A0A9Q9DT03_CURCL|nr:hypothetical protein yc1106_04548 [Curvularia clavata]